MDHEHMALRASLIEQKQPRQEQIRQVTWGVWLGNNKIA